MFFKLNSASFVFLRLLFHILFLSDYILLIFLRNTLDFLAFFKTYLMLAWFLFTFFWVGNYNPDIFNLKLWLSVLPWLLPLIEQSITLRNFLQQSHLLIENQSWNQILITKILHKIINKSTYMAPFDSPHRFTHIHVQQNSKGMFSNRYSWHDGVLDSNNTALLISGQIDISLPMQSQTNCDSAENFISTGILDAIIL